MVKQEQTESEGTQITWSSASQDSTTQVHSSRLQSPAMSGRQSLQSLSRSFYVRTQEQDTIRDQRVPGRTDADDDVTMSRESPSSPQPKHFYSTVKEEVLEETSSSNERHASDSRSPSPVADDIKHRNVIDADTERLIDPVNEEHTQDSVASRVKRELSSDFEYHKDSSPVSNLSKLESLVQNISQENYGLQESRKSPQPMTSPRRDSSSAKVIKPEPVRLGSIPYASPQSASTPGCPPQLRPEFLSPYQQQLQQLAGRHRQMELLQGHVTYSSPVHAGMFPPTWPTPPLPVGAGLHPYPGMGMWPMPHPYLLGLPLPPGVPPSHPHQVAPPISTSSTPGRPGLEGPNTPELAPAAPQTAESPLDLSDAKKRKHSESSDLASPLSDSSSPAETPEAKRMKVEEPLDLAWKPRKLASPDIPKEDSREVDNLSRKLFKTGHAGTETPSKADATYKATSSPQKSLKESSLQEDLALQGDFLELTKMTIGQPSAVMAAVLQLQQQYRCAVQAIEMERHRGISGSADCHHNVLHERYDQQRLSLTKKTRELLSEERAKLSQVSPTRAPMPYLPAVPMLPFPHGPLPAPPSTPSIHPSSPLAAWGYPSPGQCTAPPERGCSPYASSTTSSISPPDSGDDQEPPSGKKRKFLKTSAVGILTEWYERNRAHPYPDDDTVRHLATTAGISELQVKKWMANKRVRSCNTLAFNGSIHPKKFQKLMQLKEAVMNPPSDMITSKPPAVDSQGSRTCHGDHQPKPASGSRASKGNRFLQPSAVEYMSRWYAEHISYPYPTDEEKNTIARDAGITVSQVTCWFANKRNRSNNTRKIATKRMWQNLNDSLHTQGAQGQL